MLKIMSECPLVQFDCKCWTVPTYNDVFAWLKYRQNDCIRNSKQQAAQTYIPHKYLSGRPADDQIKLLFKEKGINWFDYPKWMKHGRLVYKEEVEYCHDDVKYTRNVWKSHGMDVLINDDFDKLNLVPKRD